MPQNFLASIFPFSKLEKRFFSECSRIRTVRLFSSFLGGEHTRVKSVVHSKVGGLAAFLKKKETCIGCKTPLANESEFVNCR